MVWRRAQNDNNPTMRKERKIIKYKIIIIASKAVPFCGLFLSISFCERCAYQISHTPLENAHTHTLSHTNTGAFESEAAGSRQQLNSAIHAIQHTN